MSEHKLLHIYGIKQNLFYDLISKKYSNKNYKMYKSLPKRIANEMGVTFSDDTPWDLPLEVFYEKIYDIPGFIPSKDQIVVDIGAYYGDSAIYWAKIFGARVIAFEPLPDIYKILVENIALNKVNVEANNVAIGNGETKKAIIIENSCGFGSMLTASDIGKAIATTKLDSINLSMIHLLKIDVEGFEVDVLEGSLKSIQKFKPKIILETHSSALRKQCNQILESLDYQLNFEGETRKGEGNFDYVTNLFYLPKSS
ncbi:MAG: FkbM family methyltransferase [Thermoplasmataceae archaeon]